ncbi:hypothetical protein TRVA0_001S08372 [Trichomonascus vanleenenianus]|uniref:uncharacterized protein n=1 Tax=Trichomonascus vanleenenianus TaxID=2268995 RepID=UPI003ECA31F2
MIEHGRPAKLANGGSKAANEVTKPTCKGTTKQGNRCKIVVAPGTKYCHWHDPAKPPKKGPPTKDPKKKELKRDSTEIQILQDEMERLSMATSARTKSSPGFIYMYAFDSTQAKVHIFNHANHKYTILNKVEHYDSATGAMKQTGLFNLLKQKLSSRSTPHDPVGMPSPHSMILIKIGFTRKTPSKRLQEWRRKCSHPIALLSPPPRTPAFSSFSAKELGWYTGDPVQVERAILSELRGLFGFGYVECNGCVERGKQNSLFKNDPKPNRHIEWFFLPKSKLPLVFDTIHYWVSLYPDIYK